MRQKADAKKEITVRKFSVPFTWEGNVGDYIAFLKKNAKHIDSVYFSLPHILGVESHYTVIPKNLSVPPESLSLRDLQTLKFLVKSNGIVKRIAAINQLPVCLPYDEYEKRIKELIIPFLKMYKIEAVILTHLYVGKFIREALPDIEIQTSCNGFHFIPWQMDIWRDELGVEIFNPPREVLRTPSMLREFKKKGYKIKALVNDACMYGCPYQVTHAASNANFGFRDWRPQSEDCTLGKPENLFRSNWVLPRWLPKLDDYVDIYKIVGRGFPLSFIQKATECYINLDDDINLLDILSRLGTTSTLLDKQIPCSAIPDELLTCCAGNCKTCGICEKLVMEYL
jgi:collagenase-like PrtC family protease